MSTPVPGPSTDPREVEHLPDCTAPQIVRNDATRFAQLACRGCGAIAVVPRRVEWTEEA